MPRIEAVEGLRKEEQKELGRFLREDEAEGGRRGGRRERGWVGSVRSNIRET